MMGGTEMDEKDWKDIFDNCDVNRDGQVKIYIFSSFLSILDFSKRFH